MKQISYIVPILLALVLQCSSQSINAAPISSATNSAASAVNGAASPVQHIIQDLLQANHTLYALQHIIQFIPAPIGPGLQNVITILENGIGGTIHILNSIANAGRNAPQMAPVHLNEALKLPMAIPHAAIAQLPVKPVASAAEEFFNKLHGSS